MKIICDKIADKRLERHRRMAIHTYIYFISMILKAKWHWILNMSLNI
jgi:hypothetical protein